MKLESFIHLVSLTLLVFIFSSRQSRSFTTTENTLRSSVLLDRKHRISIWPHDFSRAATSSSSIDEQDYLSRLSKKRNTRAGQDGYSLLRQPLQRNTWDSSKDPKFKTPKNLNEDGMNVDKKNSDWWSSKQAKTRNIGNIASPYNFDRSYVFDGDVSSAPASSNPSSVPAEDQTLDLFQRSSDTLDFPLILGALRAQCYTIPAKEIVKEAADHSEQKQKNKSLQQY